MKIPSSRAMARIDSYDKMRRQLSSWEVGVFEQTCNLWLMLLGGINERDLGRKLTAIDGLRAQLDAWWDLLEVEGKEKK